MSCYREIKLSAIFRPKSGQFIHNAILTNDISFELRRVKHGNIGRGSAQPTPNSHQEAILGKYLGQDKAWLAVIPDVTDSPCMALDLRVLANVWRANCLSQFHAWTKFFG
jgi:hypothetical protein